MINATYTNGIMDVVLNRKAKGYVVVSFGFIKKRQFMKQEYFNRNFKLKESL